LGQYHRFVTVAHRRLRRSRQQPGQFVQGFYVARFGLQGHLILDDRFVHSSLLKQKVAKIVLGIRVIRLDLQSFLVMNDCFVHPSLLEQSVAEVVVGLRVCPV